MDSFAAFGSWLFVVNTWFLTAAAVAVLLASFDTRQWSGGFCRRAMRRTVAGRFERFWCVETVACSRGLACPRSTHRWRRRTRLVRPMGCGAAVLRHSSASCRSFTRPDDRGALYVQAICPARPSEETDEREQEIQGVVYRRVHSLLVGLLVLAIGLLVFNPAIGSMVAGGLSARNVESLDVAVPTFLVLYMLPSVVYAWSQPHREDDELDGRLSKPRAASGEAG